MVASIGCSLFWVGFAVSKPLSQIHRSTLLPLQDTDPTPSFGGFGLRGGAIPFRRYWVIPTPAMTVEGFAGGITCLVSPDDQE